ncbi:MAG: hypothetical protein Q9191_008519, partial [Dirinaria sp. TL-2023a]
MKTQSNNLIQALTTTKPFPALETLPSEIRHMILLALPDPTALRALIHASPNYHATYLAKRKQIFTILTLRTLHHRKISLLHPLRFAEVLLPRQHLDPFSSSPTSTLWTALSSISIQISIAPRKPVELSIDECRALLHLVDVVAWWIEPTNGAVGCSQTMQ